MNRATFALVSLVLFISPGFSQVIHVPLDLPTVQAGIDSASVGDTVLVAEGTYLENIDFHGKAITVASHFLLDGDTAHISRTILDGSQPEDPDKGSTVTMLRARDTTSVLCGFTITGGSGTGEFETMFPGVYARIGGGIFSAGGKIISNILLENHVAHHQVASGGGLEAGNTMLIPADTGINLVIRDNYLFQNSCSTEVHYALGGGMVISLTNGTSLVENNQIHHNITFCDDPYKAMSGGMAASKFTTNTGTGIIRNNHIYRNEAHSEQSFGGGVFYITFPSYDISEEFSPTRFYNNVIHSNYSENYGGGICLWYLGSSYFAPPVDPVLSNNTIVDNEAARGTGICIIDSEVVMYNNILWNHARNETGEEIFTDVFRYCPGYRPQWCKTRNHAKLHAGYNNIRGGYQGERNFSIAPLFVDSARHLANNCANIGRGTDSLLAEGTWYTSHDTDCEGNIRPSKADPLIDVGAFESDREQVLLPVTHLTDIWLYNHLLDPVFDPEIFSYQMGAVDTMVNSVNLKAIPADNLAQVEIQHALDIASADLGDRSAIIHVTSSDSSTSADYWVEFYYLSADATLSNLHVAGYNLQPSFQPDTLRYRVFLPSGTAEVPEITYEPSHDAAEVTYNPPLNIQSSIDFRRTATVEVEAEDGFRQRSYSIQFDLTLGLDNEPSDSGGFRIFPNPVERLLHIEIAAIQPVEIYIHSLDGKVLFSRSMTGQKCLWDLSHLRAGIYLVTLQSANKVIRERIIKL